MKTSKFKRAFSFVLVIALAFTMALVAVPTETQAATKKITLSASKKTVGVGNSFTLKVKSVKGLSSKNVTWKTSKASVAKISSKKNTSVKVTGVKKGTAVITATSTKKKKVTAKCKVTVKQLVTNIQAPSTMYVQKGKSITIKPVVVTPSGASKKVTYTSNKKKIATVNAKGKVTAKKVGTAKITIKATDGSKKKATVTIKVQKKKVTKVTKVTLDQTSLTLTSGGSATLKATIKPAKATAAKNVTWTTSNPAVATVTKNGVVTAAKGITAVKTVTITATSADGTNKSAKCKVTVLPAAESVTVTLDKATLTKVGDTATATAKVEPADASQTVEWSTSDEKIATVDKEKGIVTAVANGKATITATTANGIKGSADVTVDSAVVATGIKVSVSTVEIKGVGNTATVSATIEPSDVTEKTVTWKSSNDTIAKVSPTSSKSGESVTITGVKEGTATITASTSSGKTATVTVTVKEDKFSYSDTGYLVELDGTSKYTLTVGNEVKTIDSSALAKAYKDYQNSLAAKTTYNVDYFYKKLSNQTFLQTYAGILGLSANEVTVTKETDNANKVTINLGSESDAETFTVEKKDDSLVFNSGKSDLTVQNITYEEKVISADVVEDDGTYKVKAELTENKITITKDDSETPVATISFANDEYTIWAQATAFTNKYTKLTKTFTSLPSVDDLQTATLYKN